MKKILFIGNQGHEFVKRDYQILHQNFKLETIDLPSSKLSWLKYITDTKKKINNNDIVFCWFAGWHSVPAIYYSKKYKKKSVVVAGGYDVVFLPEINYGAFTSIKERTPAKYVLNNADFTVSVSKSNQRELLEKITPKKNILIYNGVPLNDFPYNKAKEQIVITVGGIKASNLKRKGIEIFVKSAKYLPDIKFVVIGKIIDDSINYLKSIASNNVQFIGFATKNELLNWYQRSKVYVQVSAHEGFGITVAESMLCGCIPVVSNRFSLPEVAGKLGFYVDFGNVKGTADAIQNALKTHSNIGEQGRKRIMEKFSLKNRENKLINLIEEIS